MQVFFVIVVALHISSNPQHSRSLACTQPLHLDSVYGHAMVFLYNCAPASVLHTSNANAAANGVSNTRQMCVQLEIPVPIAQP